MPPRVMRKDKDNKSKSQSTAEYIAEMAHELAQLAKHSKLESLGYLLQLAELEANRSGLERRVCDPA